MSKAGDIAARFFGGSLTQDKPQRHKESPILITMDLGATEARAMAAKIDENDKIHVLATATMPVEPTTMEQGIVTHTTRMSSIIEDCFAQMAPAINHYRGTHRRRKDEPFSSVFLSVGDSSMHDSFQTSIRQFRKGHKITPDDLEDMRDECERKATANADYPTVYHTDAVEHILDETEAVPDPLNMEAESLSTRYHFLVGEEQLKVKLAETFARIPNLALEHTFSKAAALGYAILSEQEYRQGCAILDFGADTTSLYIYHDYQLIHCETLPYGSNLVTQDISTVGVLPSTAEKLKRQKGRAMESLVTQDVKVHCRSAQTGDDIYIKLSDLAYIIECRLDEIFTKLFRTLSEYSDRMSGRIYLTGMGSELTGFDQYIHEQTGCDVQYASHTDWLAADMPLEKYGNPVFTQLIGTTLLASDYMEKNVIKERPVIRNSRIEQMALDFFD